MSAFSDPKGYYRVLGLSPDADVDAIKAAFRLRAKRLHPDTNASVNADAQFRHLSEAYRVLRDPDRRRRYDAGAAAKPEPQPQPQPQPRPQPRPSAAQPPPQRNEPPKSGFSACRACGTLSAQPRFVTFHEVGGRPFAAERTTISGVFCPRCAAEAAVQASLRTWVRGLVAIPKGPFWAIPALLRNLFGGDQPVEANARMLLAQARAFLGRGDIDLARATIVQALPFAAQTALRFEAETLLASLGGAGAVRHLKSRWPRFGRAMWLQLAPFAVASLIVVTAITVSLYREIEAPAPPVAVAPPAAKTLVALPSGPTSPLPVMNTVHDRVPLRGGPAIDTPVLARLPKGTMVTLTALVPGEDWVQVRLADGRLGFIQLTHLQ